jgi:glucose/mannose transport system permease protein
MRRRWNWERVVSVLLISPAVAAIAVFVYYFIARTAYTSLTKWDKLMPDFTFVGLSNYQKLFANQRFRIDMRNTVVFTLVFLVACLLLGLVLAFLLDQRIKGEGFFRSVYLFPMSISFIVTGVVWRWLLNPGTEEQGSTGVNLLFEKMGLDFLKTGWYTDPRIGIIAVAIAATWQMSGYTMAMFLAGLRGIPDELREAARVDGASEVQIVRSILLPLLRPIVLSAVIVLGHISLKIYDLIVAMTGPGIGFATDVPAYYMWDTTFRGNHFARGAAIAMILLIMVAVLIVPYLTWSTRSEAEL